jgi:type IV pilus assembly protein PilQ
MSEDDPTTPPDVVAEPVVPAAADDADAAPEDADDTDTDVPSVEPTGTEDASEEAKADEKAKAPDAEGAKAPAAADEDADADDTAQVAVNPTGTFEIHVQGAELRGVLQLLSTQGRKNIVATKEVTGQVTADLYGVTFEEALQAVLRATGFAYEEKGNFIYVYTQEQYQKIREGERQTEVRAYQLDYITASDAQALIKPAMSKDGEISTTPEAGSGIATSKVEAGGNSYSWSDTLVVRDYAENLDQVAEILKQVDVKPQQVLIEATILRATLTENNALGIDFNVLSGIDFEGLGTTSDFTGVSAGTAGPSQLGDGLAGFSTDFSAGVPAGGLSVGVITNNVAFFVRALESITDTTVLANPKLLVLNKQRGEVMIGNRDGYLTTTVTETAATQSVQFLETGTRLIVRPYVAKDGYIRMEVHPEDSSGSVTEVGSNVLPSETTTEVTSNVLVRDGRTIVIGGLFRERTSSGRSQVPGIGNVPYLGTLFRRTSDDTVREEIIILLTPHIIRQDEDEATSEAIKQDVERYRIGQRKGVRWWGRERLAQQHLTWAREELARGNKDKALWNVDQALTLNPRMIEAIRLKERLTNSAYWADENRSSTVRHIVQRMIMQELGHPVDSVVIPDRPLDVEKIDPEAREELGIKPQAQPPLTGPDWNKAQLKVPAPSADQVNDRAPEEQGILEDPVVIEPPQEPQADLPPTQE